MYNLRLYACTKVRQRTSGTSCLFRVNVFCCFGEISMKRLENEFLVRCLKFPHTFLSLRTQACSLKYYGEGKVEQYVSFISMRMYEIY